MHRPKLVYLLMFFFYLAGSWHTALAQQRAALEGTVVNSKTGAQYVNHLNAKNPFTGQPLPEPGRVFFADLQFTF